jgi:hypothetical protein
MIEQLFGSKTRVKLLKMFYSNPNRSFYVREITRKIDEQINSVRRELSNLLSIGIIASDTTNNRLYYEVNQEYEYYKPLAAIFGGAPFVLSDKPDKKPAKATAKTPSETAEETQAPVPAADVPVIANDPIVTEFQQLGNVEIVLYTGQFTRDETSGIDILIVGDLNQTKLNKFMSELENKESKEIRFAAMTPSEFKYRRQVKDRFLSTVVSSKKQILLDKHHSMEE